MSPDEFMQLVSQLLWHALVISAPLLLALLTVGVLVSVLQVITQIQEMTLTFIPKLIVAVVVIAALGPWMLRHLMFYATSLYKSIPHSI